MSKARDLANASTALTTVSPTELGYLDGVTSNIQTQFGNISGSKAQPDEPASPTDGMIWVDTNGSTTDANFIPNTLTTTTGDTIYASSANTPARLGIGSTGNVLTVAGGVPTWAAPAGGGKVLQVVYGSTTSGVANSTSTYADTNLTATITPTATTSKILVLVSQNGLHKSSANTLNRIGLKLFRGATEIAFGVFNYLPTATLLTTGSASYSVLDTPATTSATTYKTQFANLANAATVVVQDNSDLSTLILMEIGA